MKLFSEDEFLEKRGINLKLRLEKDDYNYDEVERFIDQISTSVFNHIKKYNPNFKYMLNLNTETLSILKLASYEQAEYILANGDIASYNGYDMFTHTLISKTDLERNSFSANSHQILLTGGLLYAAI